MQLYSSIHHRKESSLNGKPKIIVDYNKTKYGVDIFDEMLQNYAYRPPVRRWPLRIFMSFIVDGAALNAYTLYGKQEARRRFIHKLADQLMEQQKNLRSSSVYHPTNKFQQISDIYKR